MILPTGNPYQPWDSNGLPIEANPYPFPEERLWTLFFSSLPELAFQIQSPSSLYTMSVDLRAISGVNIYIPFQQQYFSYRNNQDLHLPCDMFQR